MADVPNQHPRVFPLQIAELRRMLEGWASRAAPPQRPRIGGLIFLYFLASSVAMAPSLCSIASATCAMRVGLFDSSALVNSRSRVAGR